MLFAEGVSYLQPYSLAVIIILFFNAFDRWLWRIPPVARSLHYPVLWGTWKSQLKSSWIDHSTGQGVELIDVLLVIRQTYSTVSMRLMTKESSSRSLVAPLEAPSDDVARISSTYQNIPGLLIQGRSRIHHGSLMLEVHGSPVNRLTGSYWTDRDTKGALLLESRLPKVCTNFEEASEAMWVASGSS